MDVKSRVTNLRKLRSYLAPEKKKMKYNNCIYYDQKLFIVVYMSPNVKNINKFDGKCDFLGVFSDINQAYKCGVNRILNDLFVYVEFHNSMKSRKKVDLDNDFVRGKTNELSIRQLFHYVQCYFNNFFNPADQCYCTIVKSILTC